jgi:hypothetical protein
MLRIIILAALSSLAITASASAKDVPHLQFSDDDIAGCNTDFSPDRPDAHLKCDNGDYLTIVGMKSGTPTVHRTHVAKVTPVDLEPVSSPASSFVSTETGSPCGAASLPPPAGYTRPLPPRACNSGERWGCNPWNNEWACSFFVVDSTKKTDPRIFLFSSSGTYLTVRPGNAQAAAGNVSSPSVDDRLRVASFNGRHTGELEHEATSEAVVRHTVDGGVYTASYQKPQSILPTIAGIIAIELAGGVSNRIAHGNNGGYYGSGVPIGPFLSGGSCGGCQRNGY